MKNKYYALIILLVALMLNGCYMVKKTDDYYGISTTTAKKFIFLIDISGSMEGKAETDLQGNVIASATSRAADEVGERVGGIAGDVIRNQTNQQLTKLGKAKKELIPAIRGLSEDCYFTIITFENEVKTWRKELVQATSANKNLAITFINALESGGGTNIYESLEKAFEMAGDGLANPEDELGVETIFLLSDGAPSAGSITDPNDIITAVEQWNSLKRVNLHTVGLGEDCDEEFMKALATSNNGNYIDR